MSMDKLPTVRYKGIVGFPGYVVGDNGKIWTRFRRMGCGIGSGTRTIMVKEWRRLKGVLDKNGYRKVILCRGSKRRYVHVYTIVLETFVGLRPDNMTAAHYNGIRHDDRLENLSWKTQKDNIADKVRHGTAQVGEKHPRSIITDSDVLQMRKMRREGKLPRVIASHFKLKIGTVYAAICGNNWGHLPGAVPPRTIPKR